MTEVRFTKPFQRRFKALAKRYHKIQQDIQPIVDMLQTGEIIGNQLAGTNFIVFKVRAKNSDIPVGKSGGYRVVYSLAMSSVLFLKAESLSRKES
jgi:mRNA-degrading endonuclease RelE of RelBE toxin-antitoxin system